MTNVGTLRFLQDRGKRKNYETRTYSPGNKYAVVHVNVMECERVVALPPDASWRHAPHRRRVYWLRAASLHTFEQKWSAMLLGIFKHMMQALTWPVVTASL